LLSALILISFAAFLVWEWWVSFPRVRLITLPSTTSKEEKLDSLLTKFLTDHILPGISVAVVKQGKVTYLKAFGKANLDTGDSLTVDSEIPVASLSKIFTALGLASFLDESEIVAEDSLYKLGGNFWKEESEPLSNLGFSQLLTHTSGLRDPRAVRALLSGQLGVSLDTWGSGFLEAKFFDPNAVGKYQYADANFDLIGYLLEKSSELNFDSLTQTEIFIPAGMKSSVFDENWLHPENMTKGYQRTLLWKRLRKRTTPLGVFPSPSSGLITTTKDMSHAIIHLLRSDMGAWQRSMQWLAQEDSLLGFQEVNLDGDSWLGHFGGMGGFSSMLFYSEKRDSGIFIFFNAADQDDLRKELAESIVSLAEL